MKKVNSEHLKLRTKISQLRKPSYQTLLFHLTAIDFSSSQLHPTGMQICLIISYGNNQQILLMQSLIT